MSRRGSSARGWPIFRRRICPDCVSSSGGPPPAVAPTNDVLPVLGGTVSIGASPTVTPGVWSGTEPISYLYTLRRDGTPITGLVDVSEATIEAYAYVAADIGPDITLAEQATNVAGTATAVSNAVAYDPTVALSPRALFDAADGVTLVGSDVDQWDDQSGNTRHMTVAGSGNRPAFSASGFNGGSQPYIEGDGVAEWLRRAGTNDFWSEDPPSPTITAYTVLYVWSELTRVAGNVYGTVAGATTSAQPRVRQQATSTAQLTNLVSTITGPTTPTTLVVEATANGTQQRLFYNGTSVAFAATTFVLPTGANNGGFAIFAQHNGSLPVSGRFAMVVALEREITANERATFQAYAAWRWGLPA